MAEEKKAKGMRNVKMEVEGNILRIEVDLSKDYGPSSTGKTLIISSTAGPKRIPGDKPISLNMTIFRKNLDHKL